MIPTRSARFQSFAKAGSITSSPSYSDLVSAHLARGAQMSTDRSFFLTNFFFVLTSARFTGWASAHSGTLAMSWGPMSR